MHERETNGEREREGERGKQRIGHRQSVAGCISPGGLPFQKATFDEPGAALARSDTFKVN